MRTQRDHGHGPQVTGAPKTLLGALAAVTALGCVTISHRGAYPPVDPTPSAPVALRVSLRPLAAADSGESQRLTESFWRDLNAQRVFDSTVPEGPFTDVLLTGSVLTKQPGDEGHGFGLSTGESILLIPIYAAWGALLLVGVPSDCEGASASIYLQAYEERSGALLRSWHVETHATACAGLYYQGWPLAKALRRATGQLLDQLRADAPALQAHVAYLRGGR